MYADNYILFFPVLQQFFFKSQVIATNKLKIGKCDDFVWVTKDELMEYFPEKAEFLSKMIISWSGRSNLFLHKIFAIQTQEILSIVY